MNTKNKYLPEKMRRGQDNWTKLCMQRTRRKYDGSLTVRQGGRRIACLTPKTHTRWLVYLSPQPQDVDSRRSRACGSKIRSESIRVRPFGPDFGANSKDPLPRVKAQPHQWVNTDYAERTKCKLRGLK